MSLSTIERAARYLREMPGAISGSGGHAATFEAAAVLVRGFGLDEETAFRLLKEVHNPLCQPIWSDRDLRHKVRSAAKQSTRDMGYLLEAGERPSLAMSRVPSEQRQTLEPASYAALAGKLLDLCPFTEEPDVMAYVDKRALAVVGAQAQLGALPPPAGQAPLIQALLKTFDQDVLARAGLVRRTTEGRVELERFAFPGHRLLIPWRGPGGSVDVLQRRRLDTGEPKYVFPPGMRPRLPFGAEALRASDLERTLVLAEGALDVLALRLLDQRDRLGLLPLGLPGVKGWQPDWARFAKGRTVRIALDADAAGDAETRKLADQLYEAGAARVQRWRLTDAKDWAEAVARRAS